MAAIGAPGVRIMDLDRTAPGGDPLADLWHAAVERGVHQLDETDQLTLVDTAITLVEQFYAHLPLKRSMYAVDPLQQLRLLRQRVGPGTAEVVHRDLGAVFAGLHDAHTRYVGPTSLRGFVAALGFFVEEYGPPGARRYVAARIAGGDWLPPGSGLREGVEVTYWNGTPMARAVEALGEAFTGAHADARRARCLESLTFRSLQYEPLPIEHWVDVGFRAPARAAAGAGESARAAAGAGESARAAAGAGDPDGTDGEVRLFWRVFTPAVTNAGPVDPNPAALAMGIDHPGRAVQTAKADLYAPAGRRRRRRSRRRVEIETAMPHLLSAWKLTDTPAGEVGLLRLWHFDTADPGAFVGEVAGLLERLPHRGLIIDIRSNPGGTIWAAERLLQLLTPNRIEPARFSLPVTELTRALAANDAGGAELGPWQASLEEALTTGERYSRPLPLTSLAACNDIGQVYGGPVVCIADARTYSAGDLFAAGFVDNGVGTLVTVGEATGGGGANVWSHVLLQARLNESGTVTAALPEGCGFTLAFRRATRAPTCEGRPIEDVGVAGHIQTAMTRADVVGDNEDLLRTAARALLTQRFTSLRLQRARGDRSVTATASGLDRLRVTVDELDTTTVGLVDGHAEIALPERWQTLEVEGIGAGQVQQRRRIHALG
jgi:hypothetical protein